MEAEYDISNNLLDDNLAEIPQKSGKHLLCFSGHACFIKFILNC